MNKLGIFMNFWEKNWDADHAKYIDKVAKIGFDILEFQAQPLLDMTDDHIRELRKRADAAGIRLTYSLGLNPHYDVSSLDESIRQGGVKYLQNIIRKMAVGGGDLLSGVSYAGADAVAGPWSALHPCADDTTYQMRPPLPCRWAARMIRCCIWATAGAAESIFPPPMCCCR